MTANDDLLSDDITAVHRALDILDSDLRKKCDRADKLDALVELSGSSDETILLKVTWCAAKMGQNKVNDLRIISILTKFADHENCQIRENVAWGIGETAGTVEANDDPIGVVTSLLDDGDKDVRGMAAWAAGRFHHKCGIMTDNMRIKLKGLLNDGSEYVRKAAKFALEDG